MTNEERLPVNMYLTMDELLQRMGEGNPGGLHVICDLLKSEGGFIALLDADDMNIRGSQLWAAFKDYAGNDLKKLKVALTMRDMQLVTTLNGIFPGGPFAVTNGASHHLRKSRL